jgi:predicted nucleotidyltransferase
MIGGAMDADLFPRVTAILNAHPQVRSVRLAGSRARGTATTHSDWDFLVDVTDFPALATDLPALVAPLGPLAQLWDPLSRRHVYALVLSGPVKVDLLFDVPHEAQPPWRPGPGTMPAIDAHFWDWLLWLVGKRQRGDRRLVHDELAKMHGHLLHPLGVAVAPDSLEEAVAHYLAARERAETTFDVRVPRRLQDEVQRLLGR